MRSARKRSLLVLLLCSMALGGGGTWLWLKSKEPPKFVSQEEFVSPDGRTTVHRGTAGDKGPYLLVLLDGKFLQCTLLPDASDEIVKVVTIPTDGLPADQQFPVGILIRTIKDDAEMLGVDGKRAIYMGIGRFDDDRLVYNKQVAGILSNVLE